jgi:hypothetical protein
MSHPKIRTVPSSMTTVDRRTGERTTKQVDWHLVPPAAGTCQVCAATPHGDEVPHNAESLYYQYAFCGAQGRWPTWADAVAHCTPETQSLIKQFLLTHESGNRWTEPPEGVAPIAHLGEEVAHR